MPPAKKARAKKPASARTTKPKPRKAATEEKPSATARAPAKTPAKTPAKPAAKTSAKPTRAPAGKTARAPVAKEPRPTTTKAKPAKPAAPEPKPARAKPPAAPRAPVERTRIVFPKEVYETRKDEVKAPLKEHGLKWQYLGEGKGRYHREGVNVFVQFQDDGTHYSLWGSDARAVEALKAEWRGLLGEDAWQSATARGADAAVEEKQAAESEEIRAWRIGEPQRQPREPEFWYRRRRAEWEARKPGN